MRRSITAVIWPDQCLLCGVWLHEDAERGVCTACLAQIRPLRPEHLCRVCGQTGLAATEAVDRLCPACREAPPAFDAARAYAVYDASLRHLILHYKFKHQSRLHIPLGNHMGLALDTHFADEEISLVTHVPLHWRRRMQRGFDQTELLARFLARRSGRRHMALLKRTRHTPPQSTLDPTRRTANIRGTFTCRAPQKCRDHTVLLVDDILTTGATVDECARILKEAGVARVLVLTLARVELD
ncbi:MAG: ComF family protein [Acidobacteria bacterium]|nr:ComF family protein [Acidobacteriota bacterium]